MNLFSRSALGAFAFTLLASLPAMARAADGGSATPSARATPADAGPGDGQSSLEASLSNWSGLSIGWDVRGEAIALFKRYTIDGQDAWYSGQGAGGGASLSLHFRPAAALSQGVLRWIEFELGVSNSTHFVRWEEGGGARPRADFVDNHTSGILGFHIATGRYTGSAGEPWSGAVLGLAWMPTYVYFFGNDAFDSGGKLNHAGLRLSVDWGRVSPASKGLVPGLRASLTWLPYIGSLPSAVSAGVGCVFY